MKKLRFKITKEVQKNLLDLLQKMEEDDLMINRFTETETTFIKYLSRLNSQKYNIEEYVSKYFKLLRKKEYEGDKK